MLDGGGGVGGLHPADHEASCLDGAQRGFHHGGLFQRADDDGVGVLQDGRPDAILEGIGVRADLALRHAPLLAVVEIFDRLLDEDAVPARGGRGVEVVHHRGDRRGAAGLRGAADDDQAGVRAGGVDDGARQVERLERREHVGDDAHDDHVAGALPQDVDPEPADAAQAPRAFVFLEFVDPFDRVVGLEHPDGEGARVSGGERRRLECHQRAIDARLDDIAGTHVDVGGAAAHRVLEQELEEELERPGLERSAATTSVTASAMFGAHGGRLGLLRCQIRDRQRMRHHSKSWTPPDR